MSPLELPAPWGAIADAIQATARLADSRYYDLKARCDSYAEDVAALTTDNAALRDEIAALANRIESVTRALNSRTEHLA